MFLGRTTFLLLWHFIIVVSAIDGYLVFRHRFQMLTMELNPVANALVRLNEGNVWYLLLAKLVGTIVVCATLLSLWHINPRLGFMLTVAVAIFQLMLALVLAVY